MSNNPYVPPQGGFGPGPGGFGGPPMGGDPNYALNKVSGPATGLLVFAGIGIAFQVLSFVVNIAGVGAGAAGGAANDQEGMQLMAQGIGGIIGNVIGTGIGVLIIVGALKMKKLESYGLAKAAAIISMVPCLSPCCIIGLPIGIWALTTLNDPGVKQGFRS